MADPAPGAEDHGSGALDAAHGAAAHGGHGAEAAGGMPQLDFTTFPSQIFWLIVALVVLYYFLSRVGLPQIAGAIEERHDAIEDDLDRAAEFKRRAQQAEHAYEAALANAKAEVAKIAAEAKAATQAEVDKVIAKAEAEIAAKTAESEARIEAVRAEARASIETVARDTAGALVASLSPGFTADQGAIDAAVSARLS
jgi:F-type H+-transporting ATPase subunit b